MKPTPGETRDWMIGNFGPRCTLVSAASVLRRLGARPQRLVSTIEGNVHFHENPRIKLFEGPSLWDYVGIFRPSRLDRAIELAARQGGIEVRSRTVLFPFWTWRRLRRHFDSGGLAILNCLTAPSGSRFHSVVAAEYTDGPPALLTIDPNDMGQRKKIKGNLKTGIVTAVTFVERVQ